MDYYSILGVQRTASQDEIKKAFKRKAMQHHPDRGGNQEEFKRVTEAYEILSNSDKRSAYDNPGPNFNYNSNDFAHGQNPFAGTPFDHIFNNGFAQRTPRNKDIHLRAEIGLADVLTGKTVVIQYSTQTGRIETVTCDIPPGAKHGDTVRYQGLGDDGHPGFQRGDLHVKLYVQKVKNWERDQNNLICKKIINVFDLMLGCVIIVNTLDNKQVKLTIPKGTKIGQVFNIPNYGIPDLHTGKRGNLYVSIDAEIPKITNENILKEIELLKDKIR